MGLNSFMQREAKKIELRKFDQGNHFGSKASFAERLEKYHQRENSKPHAQYGHVEESSFARLGDQRSQSNFDLLASQQERFLESQQELLATDTN